MDDSQANEITKAIAKAKLEFPMPGHRTNIQTMTQDEELMDALFAHVTCGHSLKSFCDVCGFTPNVRLSLGRFLGKLKEGDLYFEEWEAAKKARAVHFADRMLEITEQVAAGEMTPQQASAALKGLQWLAARVDPEAFGDRMKVDQKVTMDTTEQHLNAVRAMAEMVKRGDDRGVVIDSSATDVTVIPREDLSLLE